MSAKQKFAALCEEHGIEPEIRLGGVHPYGFGREPWQIDLSAPDGKLFATSRCHYDCSISGRDGELSVDWKQAASELKDIVASGFVDCDDPDCEICQA